MRKKSIMLCGFTCIMGIFGAFLRWIQTMSVFEPETGLATPYAPASFVVAFFLIGGAAAFFFLVRSLRSYNVPDKYPEALSRSSKIYQIAALIVGAVTALGSAIILFSYVHSYIDANTMGIPLKKYEPLHMFNVITCIFSFISAISMTVFIRNAKPGSAKKGTAPALVLMLFLCYWLIASYKFSASDPVIWHFAPRLLAISATLLAFYYIAGFVFGKPRPLQSLYFCQLGAFLGIVTFADDLPIGEKFVTAGFVLMMLLVSFILINNMTEKAYDKNTKTELSE